MASVFTCTARVWTNRWWSTRARQRRPRADNLGSVIGTADATGTSTAIYSYGPYGEPNTISGQRFRYTGQQLIGGLGLYYYKARFYSPTLGRFLQTDPIGYLDDMNLYAYVGGNPSNRVDPRGLSSQEVYQIACAMACSGLITRPLPGPVGGIPGNNETGGYNPVTDTMSPYQPNVAQQLTNGVNAVANWVNNLIFNQGADTPANTPDPASGSDPDRGGLTTAGRAQQKHGDREGSAFDPAKGTPQDKNAQGQRTVDSIVNSPDRVDKPNRHGGIDVLESPGGRGARFGPGGKFTGFLEP